MKKLFVFSLFLILSIYQSMAQCPMCKTAVESNLKNDGATVGKGLNDGILYLLSAPYIAVLAVGIVWFLNYRKKKLQATNV